MPNTVKILRSTTAGSTPTLVSGQIAINEADGKLYYRNASGVVTVYAQVAEYSTRTAFPATGVAGIMYVSIDNGQTYRWNTTAYKELGPTRGTMFAFT